MVCEKPAGFAPPIAIDDMLSAAFPLLVSVAVCAGLVVPVVAVKVSEVGASDTTGTGTAVPVPVSATDCGEPVALSVTATVAPKLATEAGVKETWMAQFAPAASEAPQLLVCAKSVGLAPAIAMEEMLSAAPPGLDSVSVCVALVVFTV